MPLIIEDGNIVTGANSYVSVADFETRLTDLGIFLTFENGTPEQLLLRAMDYIEAQNFQGYRYTKEQPLQWPRSGVVVDGFSVDTNEIPNCLPLALMEVAVAIDAGNDPLSVLGRETKREKVADIEVEYSERASDTVELRAVNAHLDKLIVRGSNTAVIGLSRA